MATTSQRRPLRIAVAGLGRMGKLHTGNLKKLDDVEIVGVYDCDPALIVWKQANLPAACHFAMTYDDLLNLDDIDLVWIVSPTKEHVMMIQAAVQAGKHVFCEKPIGRTVEEAEQIHELSHRYPDQVILRGFSRRFDPSYKAALLRNDVGTAHLIHSQTLDLDMSLDSSPIPASTFEQSLQNGSHSTSDSASERIAFFYKYAKESGGIFVDCLIHDIDLGLWLLSVNREDALIPRRVWATGSIQKYHGLAQFGDVDNAVGVVEFWNGCILNLQGSRTMVDGHDCSTTIYASQGKLKVNVLGRSDRLEVSTRQGHHTALQQCWSERFAEAFEIEAKEVVQAVRDKVFNPSQYKAPRGLSLESCVLGLQLATALQQSLRERKQLGFDQTGKLLKG